MILPITAIFIAIFALLQVPFTLAVGMYRMRTKISFLDGEDRTLMRRMRAHGNFVETTPMTLLAMAAAELSGAPDTLLIVGASLFLAGRLAHYFTIVKQGAGPGRVAGMLSTFFTLILFAGYTLAAAAGLI